MPLFGRSKFQENSRKIIIVYLTDKNSIWPTKGQISCYLTNRKWNYSSQILNGYLVFLNHWPTIKFNQASIFQASEIHNTFHDQDSSGACQPQWTAKDAGRIEKCEKSEEYLGWIWSNLPPFPGGQELPLLNIGVEESGWTQETRLGNLNQGF